MAKSKRLRFREAALISGLVNEQQLESAFVSLNEGGRVVVDEITDKQIADELVKRSLLTSYQAFQLCEGKTKFRLKDYLIVDYIGKGGMGQVFKAVHELMGREVAIKVLPRERCTPTAISSFEREIRNQAKLDHAHLVRAFDAGRDGNVYFLVTEYVPGTDLRKLVREPGDGGRLSESDAAQIVMQAAIALDYVHESGMVHRDVKPGNLLVTRDGTTKLSDLGLAGFMDDVGSDPRMGKITGTADYLAPDVVRSPRDILPVSDIYSLGCTLYYAVTGKVPFPGGTTRDKIRRHLEQMPWHPLRLNPELSEDFVEVIADMMEKDPGLRVQTAAEVMVRLEPWASEEGLMISQSSRARWLPPPIPTDDDDSDTADIHDLSIPEGSSGSQISQATDPLASAVEDTEWGSNGSFVFRSPDEEITAPSALNAVITALVIAIPVSVIIGALIAICVIWLAA